MLYTHQIDPVAIAIGPVKVYWYGLMYLVGFMAAWILGVYRAKKMPQGVLPDQVPDLLFYGALGVILGGRLGYMIFYYYPAHSFMADPFAVFKVWDGGMSFHGGLVGVLLGLAYFAKKIKQPIFTVVDFIAPMVPIGLGTGRIGNFINGELWGRVTDVPWAVIFPHADSLPRHPSQLYESFLEGLVLFVILWIFSSKPRPRMAVSGLFALMYGIFRIVIEFFREPDVQLGFVFLNKFTMGQLLSLPLCLVGILLLVLAYKQGGTEASSSKSYVR